MSDTIPIFAVSDSLGETAETLAKEAASQFDRSSWEIRRYPYVNEAEVLAEIVAQARAESGLIIYILTNGGLRESLERLAKESQVPAIDPLGPVVAQISRLTGCRPLSAEESRRKNDHESERITEAIKFAIKYDDGKDKTGLLHADLILLGVSRTSKTPVSLYLAQKGIKMANLPLLPEVPLPEEIWQVSPDKLVGLTIKLHPLTQIRQVRLRTLGLSGDAEYASLIRIQGEIAYANQLMAQLGCPVIDITNKAVEEVAGEILNIYKGKRYQPAAQDTANLYGSL